LKISTNIIIGTYKRERERDVWKNVKEMRYNPQSFPLPLQDKELMLMCIPSAYRFNEPFLLSFSLYCVCLTLWHGKIIFNQEYCLLLR
jgi:hypothetical protein